MGTQTNNLLNATTFSGLFQTSLKQWGIGLFPAGIKGIAAQGGRPAITWSSDSRYSTYAEPSPLIHIPLLPQGPSSLQDPVHLIRRYLASFPSEASPQGYPSFATIFQTLQEEIPRMDAIERLATDDPRSLSRASFVLQRSALRLAALHGPDAGALLLELSAAIATQRYTRFEAASDPEGTYRRELDNRYRLAINAQLAALPLQQDDVFDAVRIFAGLRACLAFDQDFGRMISFLVRYDKILKASKDPQAIGEHRLRMAWFVLQHARTIQEGRGTERWQFAGEEIASAIALWAGDPARAEQIDKLQWFLSGTQEIARKR